MIEKLKMHSAEEINAKLHETILGEFLAGTYIPQLDRPPTDIEMMDKINEIIDFLNKEEDGSKN